MDILKVIKSSNNPNNMKKDDKSSKDKSSKTMTKTTTPSTKSISTSNAVTTQSAIKPTSVSTQFTPEELALINAKMEEYNAKRRQDLITAEIQNRIFGLTRP